MYSDSVTAACIEKIEAAAKFKLHRYPPAESQGIAAYLEKLDGLGKLRNANGTFKLKEFSGFVRNERILCQQDFFYAIRYFKILKDGVMGGGIGNFADTFWESQRILLNLIAKLEEKNYDYFQRGYPCDGILICDNKGGRQLGHTMMARALLMHRIILWPHTRGMSASVDEDKVRELYERDKLILDNLPFFLKPKNWGTNSFGGYDKKGEHIAFEPEHGASMLYQQSNQESGIGTGRQFDVNHNTELSQWAHAEDLALDFFPTLPQSHLTFSLQETTPRGRTGVGMWWWKFSENVRAGKVPRWAYLYVPFYSEPKKYRAFVPDDWKPSELTLQMAWQVYNTSKEFVGKQVTLEREQLKWWEDSYNQALQNNELNKFLSNYSVTPEQSFQHSRASAVRPEVLDWMRGFKERGTAYSLES